ncbi:hypothetical protein [Bryocella elongata]|uniref:hypothetical protein n=1 Tax=Bryocella elongata TaxID=863522 RepID=UPI000CDEE79E|nr:hypothetical protein [Bryocella elongata]
MKKICNTLVLLALLSPQIPAGAAVPLIFYGGLIHAGTYTETVGISDVAPTLAAILHIQAPSGSVGHVLHELMPDQPWGAQSK